MIDWTGRQVEIGVVVEVNVAASRRRVQLQCHDWCFFSRRPAQRYGEGDAYEGYEEGSLAEDR